MTSPGRGERAFVTGSTGSDVTAGVGFTALKGKVKGKLRGNEVVFETLFR